MLFSREIPVKKSVDICIVGGGAAGVTAAVAAARAGAKVYLAEALGMFGGLGTAGGVPVYMTFTDGINFCADGLGREIKDRMNAEFNLCSGGRGINPEKLKRIYDDMCSEAGVDFSFFTDFIGAESNGRNVTHAIFSSKSGIFAIEAKVFIDCSGDAELTTRAGGEYMYGNEKGEVMPGTVCSHWANIDWQKLRNSGISVYQQLLKAFDDHVFRNNDPHHTGISQTANTLGGGNMGHIFGLNPLSEESLTAGMVEGRKQSVEFQNFYRKYVPGYEGTELTFTASIMGVRASRRAVGDYILCIEDYRTKRIFDDEIGRYCYPVDIHPSSTDKKEQEKFQKLYSIHYAPGESYGIPYRSLVVKSFDNMLVAGRCVSSDQYMQASVRTMPGCYILGQAAGLAAALAVAKNGMVRDIDVKELQRGLKKMGAFLPNFNE